MKKYILKYHTYGFKAGSIYTHEGDYLIHRDDKGEILHKVLKSHVREDDFQDVDTIDEHKIHRDLLSKLVGQVLLIKVSTIGLGSWWWEGHYLPYKLTTHDKDKCNIFALIPQWIQDEVNDEAHKMMDTFNVKFKDNEFDRYRTLRADFKAWFNQLMEKTFIGSINFYINDVRSIQHTSEKITSITLNNDTKILIYY